MGWFLVTLVVLCLYCLPTIIAFARGNPNAIGIGALNILLGWTFAAWAVALVLAFWHFERRETA